ncbi:hypothetical protein HF521_016681 [Silurus meridionalis]|uniref:Uncharacterized protein n=1 Tax=Silurus meridionalis TaxID=175797 RepID=A0A8T0BR59_SILME|nr:hypothetical protein HF521_016681 [Silurus meridionalis]
MEDFLMAYEEHDKNDTNVSRTGALAGLSLYLKKDSSQIFNICKESRDRDGNAELRGILSRGQKAILPKQQRIKHSLQFLGDISVRLVESNKPTNGHS